ncbi:MAG: hypothetical protein NTY41_07690 [Proteobacteria bacterium]|nr:hypothetical protein [Pseudomonadota bacterium]
MKNDLHLVLHGLAIKKHATAEAIAGIIGLAPAHVAALLQESVSKGNVVEAKGKFSLQPMARIALEGDYSRYCSELRENQEFVRTYADFEVVNNALKALITDWQVVEIAGARVPNDHGDKEYDNRIIDRLGDLHERAERVLTRFAGHLPRLAIYRDKLLAALEQAEDGALEWVSDARIESYHTLWFELHEDLLRMLGRTRVE